MGKEHPAVSETEVLRAQLDSAQQELETSTRELKKVRNRLQQTEERLQRAKGDIVNERSASDAMGAALATEESSLLRRQKRLLDAAKRFRELRAMLQQEAKDVSRQKAQVDAAWSLIAVERTGLETRRESLKRDIKRFEMQRDRHKKRESLPAEVENLQEEIDRLEGELRKVHSELDHVRADERMARTRAKGLESTLVALGNDTTIDMPPPHLEAGIQTSDTVDSPPPPGLQNTVVGPPPPMMEVEETVPGEPPLGIEVADTVDEPALPFTMPKTLVDHDIAELYAYGDGFAETTAADDLPAPPARKERLTVVETTPRRTTWVRQEAMHLHFRMRFAWDMMSSATRQWVTFGILALFLTLIAIFVALITLPEGPREPVRSAVVEPIELPPQPIAPPEPSPQRSKSKRRRGTNAP